MIDIQHSIEHSIKKILTEESIGKGQTLFEKTQVCRDTKASATRGREPRQTHRRDSLQTSLWCHTVAPL